MALDWFWPSSLLSHSAAESPNAHWGSQFYESKLSHVIHKKAEMQTRSHYTGHSITSTTDSVPDNHSQEYDKISERYLYVSELGCQIGELKHTGAEKCHRLDAELPVQALIHGLWWDTEWQPASKYRVSSLTPASFLHTLWRPLNTRRESQFSKACIQHTELLLKTALLTV